MTVSEKFRSVVYAQESDDALIICLTLDHDDFTIPIRVNSSGEDQMSRGDVFYWFPFYFIAPSISENTIMQAQLEIDNVDRSITEELRQIQTSPTVLVEFVLESDLDTVEFTWPLFYLDNTQTTRDTISGVLNVKTLANVGFPYHRFVPSYFPGLYGGIVT